MDSSSDIDQYDTESCSVVGSIQTTGDQLTEDPNQTQSLSLKEEYYSSCEEETDESYSETDSEQREESMDRELTITQAAGTIKRFSGDCERVTELLSEHDRTKNRKTYQVVC